LFQKVSDGQQTYKLNMPTIKRFEDLEIWQLARINCKQINMLIRNSKHFQNDFALVNQIKSSSGSVMDNIAEGFERGGNREFGQFLSIAKGSAGESRSQIYRAYDNEYITDNQLDEQRNSLLHLSTKISNMMTYLNQSEIKGTKYKNNKKISTRTT